MTVLQNYGPFRIWIKRDTEIGFADKMNEKEKMEKVQYKFFNPMTNQIKIKNITEEKAKPWTSEPKYKHVDKLANMNVPQE